jgi:hypothetical protein
MSKKSIIKDKRLEISLDDTGLISIESPDTKRIGIFVRKLDPTEDRVPLGAKGAIYRISLYLPEDKSHPSEYDSAFIMPDGRILSKSDSYLRRKKS